ncbi:MAG: hypothetical protein IIV04_06030 [Bacteroidaceae bacterium]|nr:hypothetical protein [Bacteroidaceae bacterium]
MKKYISLLLALFTISAAAQDLTRSITDGETTIQYSSIADAENKLIEYINNMDSYSSFPSKLFSELVVNDERCFTYNFERLIERARDVTVRPLRVVTSDDGNLRLYTWDVDGGTMSCYSGIVSYRNQKGIFSHTSETDNSWNYETAEEVPNYADIACGAFEIKRIKLSNGKHIYAVFTHSSGSSIMQMTVVEAYAITESGIEQYNLFRNNGEETNSVLFYRDPSGSFPIDIILTDEELIIPETMEGDNPFGGDRITGRILHYRFNGETFEYTGISYPDGLYKDLCDFQYNVIISYQEPWIFRIDKMPDDSYRYASWKNKKDTDVPNIVLNGGTYTSTVLDESDSNAKEEKYTFQNHDYTYEVSWIVEYFTYIHSLKVVVKHGDEVLLTITDDKE